MKKNSVKIIILMFIIIAVITGVTYAYFNYTRTGSRNEIVTGQISLNYETSDTLLNIDMEPSSTPNQNNYIAFTVDGLNTNTEKDIWYAIDLVYGDVPNNYTETNRIRDEFLRFKLTKTINNGTEETVFENNNYECIDNLRIYVETVPKGTTTEIVHNYKLYVWIGDEINVGNTPNRDYTIAEWNNLFASVKVRVLGDFKEKAYDEPIDGSRNVMNVFSNKITSKKTQITSVVFQKERQDILNDRYNAVDDSLKEEYNIEGNVKVWLEDDGSGNGTYNMFVESTGTTYLTSSSTQLFNGYTNLSSVTFNNIDTSAVTVFDKYFYDCTSLTNLDLRKFDVSNCQNFWAMFQNCTNLVNVNLSGWHTTNALNTTFMFANCEKLTGVDVSGIKTTTSANIGQMFFSCKALISVDLTGIKGSRLSQMFYGCTNLQTVILRNAEISGTSIDAWGMFRDCTNLQTVDLTNASISTIGDGGSMFEKCSSLVNIDLSNISFNSTGSLNSMFYECSSLQTVTFNTITTSSIRTMFNNCSNLENINYNHFIVTSSNTDFYGVFNNCSKLTSLDLSEFNVSGITDAQKMFYNCLLLDELDVTHFSFATNANLYAMFSHCENLEELDLSSFNITGTTVNVNNMFSYCKKLRTIYVTNLWNVTSYSSSDYMFGYCLVLTGSQGTSFTWNNPTDSTYAHVDGGQSNPGYFTLKTV